MKQPKSEKIFPDFGGYCTSSNLFIKKTGKPDPDGILSEQIFGPIVSFRCSCGFLKHKTLDYNKLCPKCGVRCIDNEARLTTSGYIKTVFPFIKYTKKNSLIKLLGKNQKQLLDPKQCDANIALNRFICIHKNLSSIIVVNDVSSCPSNHIFIPFKIGGIFTLYFVLKYLATEMKILWIQELFDNNYFLDDLEILPPNIRPIMPDPKKRNTLFFEEVNSFYISILNSNRRNKLLSPVIIEDINTWTNYLNDQLANNSTDVFDFPTNEFDQISSFYQFYIDSIYSWCFSKIKGKEGLIRNVILSRTLEYSARSVVVVDPSVKPYEIVMPRSTLFVLWMPYFLNYLTKIKKIMQFDESYYKVASKKYYELKNDPVLHKYFIEFLDWFTNSDEAEIIKYTNE